MAPVFQQLFKPVSTAWCARVCGAALVWGLAAWGPQAWAQQATGAGASSAAPRVVTSIKPIHSLVAALMQGVGEPAVLLAGNDSPHTFALRPAQARQINEAQLIFWVGPGLETFLERPLLSLGQNAEVVTLAQAPGLQLLDYRSLDEFGRARRGNGAAPAQETHETHDGHDEHDHAHGDDHGHEHGSANSAPAEASHKHGNKDMHIWLDPQNARLLAKAIAAKLTAADPAHADLYAKNLTTLDASLVDLDAQIKAQLAPVHDQPFIVFHDGYHYLENRYDLNVVGALTVSPDVVPGAARIAQLRKRLAESGAQCVFAEPQFQPRILQTLTEGTAVRMGILNPEGGEMPASAHMYQDLMRANAKALSDCLGPQQGT